MSVNVGAIRTNLKTALVAISGLQVFDVWPDTVNVPAAIVKPVSGAYHQTRTSGAGLVKLDFEVILLAAPTQIGLANGQKLLDPYLGTGSGSVQNAVEADQSVGGAASSVVCHGWKDYGSMVVNEIEYLGVKFDLAVTAS